MMLTIRRSEDRGHFDMGWLDTRHTFSFGEYYDPRYLGFSALRVINEDRVAPGKGFPTHGHRDMEIVTYILHGALEHKDSLGTGSVIRPGDVQRMSAGAGIQHSEFNHSAQEGVHFLQIWILPEQKGLPPSYEQITVSAQDRHDRLRLIGSRDGRDGSVTIHQNLGLYSALLSSGAKIDQPLAPSRAGWVQVVSGAIDLNGLHLRAGDGVAAVNETSLKILTLEPAEILLFDLPGQ
jgi:quercetin 2,3-dioxygenase